MHEDIPSNGTFLRALADREMTVRLWVKMLELIMEMYSMSMPSFTLMYKSHGCRGLPFRPISKGVRVMKAFLLRMRLGNDEINPICCGVRRGDLDLKRSRSDSALSTKAPTATS